MSCCDRGGADGWGRFKGLLPLPIRLWSIFWGSASGGKDPSSLVIEPSVESDRLRLWVLVVEMDADDFDMALDALCDGFMRLLAIPF